MNKLREIRIRKKLSQKAVSELLNCSPVAYSRYESGTRQPSIEMLIQIAEILDVSVDEILGIQSSRGSGLSEYEMELVSAARNADERARSDALTILRRHPTEDESKTI